MLKRVMWLGDEVSIPLYGVVKNADEKDFPKDMADGFIRKGLAMAVEELVQSAEDSVSSKRKTIDIDEED